MYAHTPMSHPDISGLSINSRSRPGVPYPQAVYMHSTPSLPTQPAPTHGTPTRQYAASNIAKGIIKMPEPHPYNTQASHSQPHIPQVPVEVQRELGSTHSQSSPTNPTASYPIGAHTIPISSSSGESQAYITSAVSGGNHSSSMGTHTAVPAPSHSSFSTPTTNTTSAAAKAKARALPSVVPSAGVQRTATAPSAIPPTTPTSAVPSSVGATALGPRRTPIRTPGQTPTESPQGTPQGTPIGTPTKGSVNPKRDRTNNTQHPPDQGIGATRSFSTPIDVPLNTSQNVPREASNNSQLPGLRSAHRNSVPNTLTVDQFEVIRTHSATQSHNPRAQLQLARTLCEAADQLAHRYIDPSHPSSKDVDTAQQAANRAAWVSQSISIARQLSHKLDFADAQFFMGTILTTGTYNVPADLSKALEYYLKAAKQDHSEACYRVAVCYELGMGTSRDLDRATHFYKRAAQLGSAAAMYKLGMLALSPSSSSTSNTTSISTSHPNDSAATLHDYDDNKVHGRDFAKGLEWLELAAARADSRNPHALYELGLLYEHAPTSCYVQGDPITLNETRSAELHSAAASLGYAPAQSRIGRVLEFGELGCQIDPVLNLEYYYAAANQGDADAELAMAGWCWTGGPSLPKSETDALQWAERAAQRGNTRALYCLGYFCESGVGKPVDLRRALACYEAAARRGHARAIEKVATLKSQTE